MRTAWILMTFIAAAPAWASDSFVQRDLAQELRDASRDGRYKDVEKLIQAGVDVNASSSYGRTALMESITYNRLPVARELLRAGARVDAADDRDVTALMMAARGCVSRIGALILQARPNVNRTDQNGRTALMEAADMGCDSFVRLLIQAPGIDLNAKDDNGKTALDLAAAEAILEVDGPYVRIVESLQAHGARGTFILSKDPALKRLP